MACVIKPRINPKFSRSGNLKGVADFKKESESCSDKNQSKIPTSSTLSFNRLSNSNVKSVSVYEPTTQILVENRLPSFFLHKSSNICNERK